MAHPSHKGAMPLHQADYVASGVIKARWRPYISPWARLPLDHIGDVFETFLS